MNRSVSNQLINFFWTILCFAGIFIYWYSAPLVVTLYWFIGGSLASALIPTKYYQLSRRRKYYERLGVKRIRALVQDGSWRRQGNAALIGSRIQAANYLKTVAMYQRFHMICLVFFTLSAGHALAHHRIGLAVIITISNIIYNVCPILLQQYNRARIAAIVR